MLTQRIDQPREIKQFTTCVKFIVTNLYPFWYGVKLCCVIFIYYSMVLVESPFIVRLSCTSRLFTNIIFCSHLKLYFSKFSSHTRTHKKAKHKNLVSKISFECNEANTQRKHISKSKRENHPPSLIILGHKNVYCLIFAARPFQVFDNNFDHVRLEAKKKWISISFNEHQSSYDVSWVVKTGK